MSQQPIWIGLIRSLFTALIADDNNNWSNEVRHLLSLCVSVATMSSNPIFPASRAELKALHPVLEITCGDSKAAYDEVKSRRGHPAIADAAGAEYRARVTETFLAVRTGECSSLYNDLIYCNGSNIYDYGAKCKEIRDSLQMCAIKNKLGELSK